MKQDRTLQEQASTYLQLVCSTCDLSDEKVRETAAEIQQVKLQVSDSYRPKYIKVSNVLTSDLSCFFYYGHFFFYRTLKGIW